MTLRLTAHRLWLLSWLDRILGSNIDGIRRTRAISQPTMRGSIGRSGTYLLVLSADDVLVPGALRRAAELMDSHPEVGLTYGQAIDTSCPGSHELVASQDYGRKVLTALRFLKGSFYHSMNIVSTPTAVVRTSLQKALGGYRRELPHTADMEMWLRLGAHASVGVINAIQAYYRIHSSNMSKKYVGLDDIQAKWAAFDRLFLQFGRLIEGSEDLQRLARRNLLQQVFETVSRLQESGESSQANAAQTIARRSNLGTGVTPGSATGASSGLARGQSWHCAAHRENGARSIRSVSAFVRSNNGPPCLDLRMPTFSKVTLTRLITSLALKPES